MLYQKYILRNISFHLIGVLAILILLIWFSRAVTFIEFITENGVEISQFFYLFILILPWISVYIIPISIFVALLISINRLTTSNEIIVLKNCGLSNFQITKFALYLSFIVMIFCYVNSFYLMPYANKKLRISRSEINNNYANLSFNPQTFETFKETTFFTQKRDKDNNLYGIFIHNNKSKDYSITITAKSGKLKVEENSALLFLSEGTLQRFNYASKKTEILSFDSYVFNLNENQQEFSGYKWKPNERYFHELFNTQPNISDTDLQKIRSEIHGRILNPLMVINLTIFALAFLIRGTFKRRGNLLYNAYSIASGILVLSLNVVSLKMSENSANLAIIPYLNFLIFFMIGIYLLNSNQGFSK